MSEEAQKEEFFWSRRFEKHWKIFVDWNEGAGLFDMWIKDPVTNDVVFHFGTTNIDDLRRNYGCTDHSLSKLGLGLEKEAVQ